MEFFELIRYLITLFIIFIFGKYTNFTEKIKEEIKNNKKNKIIKKVKKRKIKVGLLTNEIPPIRYGGVATWIVNWINMFKDDEDFEVIPIFLAYLDQPDKSFFTKYPNIRVIYSPCDIENVFSDIDVCVNNLWIALDTVKQIISMYPNIRMISVCHSLIKMEHLTNLGSKYTNNFLQQELTFKYSDYVVLISNAERKYYYEFGYNKYKAIPIVIYNSYIPKFDNKKVFDNYGNNNPGFIGRHVPRKRPELPILAVTKSNKENISVYNMGVDFSKNGNDYWKKLGELYKDKLNIIPFSSDKSKINKFWSEIGVNSITGIYEPFGYTICETLDRRVPAIVQNLDGPKEIIEGYEDNVFMYDVEKDINNDIDNFMKALEKFWDTDPSKRKEMAEKARSALDRFRPEIIGAQWKELVRNSLNSELKRESSLLMEIDDLKYNYDLESIYGYFSKLKEYILSYFDKIKDNMVKKKNNEIEL